SRDSLLARTRTGARSREDQDHANRSGLRLPGTERTTLPLRQGLDQTVSKERPDVPGQDPGNDRPLGQPDGRGNDPALEPANQGLDHVPPLRGEQTHLQLRRSPDLPNGVALVPATAPEERLEMDQDEILPARRSS